MYFYYIFFFCMLLPLQGVIDSLDGMQKQMIAADEKRAKEREEFELRLMTERQEWEEKRDRERREE